MGTAIIGGIVIGIFIKGWIGIFVLPVFIGMYYCIKMYRRAKWDALLRFDLKNAITVNYFSLFFWPYALTVLIALVVKIARI